MSDKTIQVYGPFFTNYSLARVNRGLAIGLKNIAKNYSISLYGEKDSIDWYPTEFELQQNPEIKSLFRIPLENTDFVIYNNYPKSTSNPHNFNNLKGKIKVAYFAWEESIYPTNWVEEINSQLDGLMVSSTFTKEIMKNSGVKIPMIVIPNALDEGARIKASGKFPLDTVKNFKFLHISTAKKRKGIDKLLKAYFDEFTKNDDVVLVLKTFPGPDNNVDSIIKELSSENSPEIVHINNPNLSEEELRNLHSSANVEVYPSRAEGFGLPILEAMYQGVPVITTNYGGQLDFCNSDNSYLLDYTLEFTTDSELVNLGAKWAEPDLEHLKKLLRKAYNEKDSEKQESMITKAEETSETYTWNNSAEKVVDFLEEIESVHKLKTQTLAVISPINDDTGISEYTEKIYFGIEKSFQDFYYLANKDISEHTKEDSQNVFRTWNSGEDSFKETLEFIKDRGINIVHIQYHSGSFFSTDSLSKLIKNLKTLNVRVYVTFHAFRSKSFDYLKEISNLESVDKIFIHNINDYNYASKKYNNFELLILPTIKFRERNKSKLREKLGLRKEDVIIASHGLMNTNKNIPEIIEAVSKLKEGNKNIKFFSINAVSSNNIHSSGIYKHCKEIVKDNRLENNVYFFTKFLKEEEVEILLQISDLIVFNYSDVGESASASVRKALASKNPIIVTDINMFSEFKDEIFKIKDTSAQSVYEGIKKVMASNDLTKSLVEKGEEFIDNNLYERKSLQMLKAYSE